MKQSMKVLVAYDGSPYAGAALADLRRSGLPRDSSILVATVSEVFPPAPPSSGEEATEAVLASSRVSTALARAHERAIKARGDAHQTAAGACERVRALGRSWEVSAEALSGAPAREIIRRAQEWRADLVVAGTQGLSAIGRFLLGSVSKSVAADAHCSVRVARPAARRAHAPGPRLVVGIDGSPGAAKAVRAFGRRAWPRGAEVLLVAVDDGTGPHRLADLPTSIDPLFGGDDGAGPVNARLMAEAAGVLLRAEGLNASVEVLQGDPRLVLPERAQEWGADCVFVGSRGADGERDETGLGGVATALVTGAPCSVEVAR
jgi:nucleotide-binding universal stress UspA family protein